MSCVVYAREQTACLVTWLLNQFHHARNRRGAHNPNAVPRRSLKSTPSRRTRQCESAPFRRVCAPNCDGVAGIRIHLQITKPTSRPLDQLASAEALYLACVFSGSLSRSTLMTYNASERLNEQKYALEHHVQSLCFDY